MEDQERNEDVDAHRRKAEFPAVEETSDEDDDAGDDVQAHQLRRPPTSGS